MWHSWFLLSAHQKSVGNEKQVWNAFLVTWKCWAGNWGLGDSNNNNKDSWHLSTTVCQAPCLVAHRYFHLIFTTRCDWYYYFHFTDVKIKENSSSVVWVWGHLEDTVWSPFLKETTKCGKTEINEENVPEKESKLGILEESLPNTIS